MIFYLTHAEIKCIPNDQTVTYAQLVIDHHPQEKDPKHALITIGCNLNDYPYELTTRTAGMVSVKIMWKSVIITP
jgi:hypothetical protein